MVLIFGVLGYFFRKADIPAAPLVLGLVLGNILEQSFRRAMTISSGNPVIFIHSFISVIFLVMAFLSVALPLVLPWVRRTWKATFIADLGK